MGVRQQRLKLKIYGHRIKTLAEENGFTPDFLAGVYDEMAAASEPVVYYEYNYPVLGYMTAIFVPGYELAVLHNKYGENGQKEELRAFGCLWADFMKEAERLINEFVRREYNSSVTAFDYADSVQIRDILPELKERWPETDGICLSVHPDGEILPWKLSLFRSRLGKRMGCSGGGSCASCQHPTCGRAFNG